MKTRSPLISIAARDRDYSRLPRARCLQRELAKEMIIIIVGTEAVDSREKGGGLKISSFFLGNVITLLARFPAPRVRNCFSRCASARRRAENTRDTLREYVRTERVSREEKKAPRSLSRCPREVARSYSFGAIRGKEEGK